VCGILCVYIFFFQAEDGIRDDLVTGVQTCALPISWIDFTQGAVQPTGNPLDVAVSGNAFLTVQTPRGERYTRNGALQINSQGQLVTSEGLQVVGQSGPIVFQPTDREISIGIDGTISV